jgi:hypothetical protein
MDQTSTFSSVNSTYNTNYGLYYEGSSTSGYIIHHGTVSNNIYGIYNQGPLTTEMCCYSVINNSDYGIQAYNNATLNIRGNDLHGNKIAIKGGGSSTSNYYNNFALNDGYNNLIDNGTSGSYSIQGKFWGISGYSVAANNNLWKSSAGAPVIQTDYVVYGVNDGLITVTDNSPEKYFTICSVPCYPAAMSLLPESADNTNYQEVTTSLGSLLLNEMVETILNEDAKAGAVYDDLYCFDLLTELLYYKFDNQTQMKNGISSMPINNS